MFRVREEGYPNSPLNFLDLEASLRRVRSIHVFGRDVSTANPANRQE